MTGISGKRWTASGKSSVEPESTALELSAHILAVEALDPSIACRNQPSDYHADVRGGGHTESFASVHKTAWRS
jgi:hypothetical protein